MNNNKQHSVISHRLRALMLVLSGLMLLYPSQLKAAQAHLLATRLADNQTHLRLVLEADQLIEYQLVDQTGAHSNSTQYLLQLHNIGGLVNHQQLQQMSQSQVFALKLQVTTPPAATSHALQLQSKLTQAPNIFYLKPQQGHKHRLVIDLPFAKAAVLASDPNYARPQIQTATPTTKATAIAKIEAITPPITALASATAVPTSGAPINAAADPTVRAWYTNLELDAAQSSRQSGSQAADWAELWLDVTLNQQAKGTQLLQISRRGELALSQILVDTWRLRLPASARSSYQGDFIYSLNQIEGLRYVFNEAQQSISIEVSPQLFDRNYPQPLTQSYVPPSPAALGVFLNYDLALTQAQSQLRFNSLYEAGVSSSAGVGIGTFLLNHSDDETDITRLESTWTYDLPQRLSSLRIGDVVSAPSNWGRSVRLGGIQWATNFATQPQFIRYPLPSFLGETALPSSLDLYVNQALVARNEVGSGPFVLNELPVVTGSGQAQIVIRDLLGRENSVSLPYYISTQLLRPGLNDFSFELGAVRQNYALRSNDYGTLAGAASFRRGISSNLTLDAHSEASDDLFNLGLNSVWLPHQLGVFNLTVAGSEGTRGRGGLIGFGFERQSAVFSLGFNSQWRSRKFHQLGQEQELLAPIQTSQAFTSLSLTEGSSLSLNYALQRYRDRADQEFIGASFNQNIAGLGFLNFSLLHFLRGSADTLIGLSFTFALDRRTTASLTAEHQNGRADALFQVQRSLPPGPGFGYRAAIGTAQDGRLDLGVSQQTNFGTYRLDYSHLYGHDNIRALASGALVFVDGDIFASRRINDAYGVVKVADYPDVRVYAENQLVAQTNSAGKALIPQLRAYEKNQIRIESADLPLSAQMSTAQMVSSPYFRSASIVDFPVSHSQGASLHLLQSDGLPVPSGAVARIRGQDGVFPVGMAGFLYLTHLTDDHWIEVSWPGHRCQFHLTFVAANDPLPDLGQHICLEVMP